MSKGVFKMSDWVEATQISDLEMVQNDGLLLRLIVSRNKTLEVCEAAVKENINALLFVPDDLYDKVRNSLNEPKIINDNLEPCSRFELMDLE